MGSFKRQEVRLAQNDDEVRQAQALRYRVSYEELSARPTPELCRLRRDIDALDGRWKWDGPVSRPNIAAAW